MHSFPSQDYELNAGSGPTYVSSKLQAGRNMQPPQSDYYNPSIGNMQFAPSQLCTARDGQSTYSYLEDHSYLEDLQADMAPNGFVPRNPSDPDPFGTQYPSNPDVIVSAPIRTLEHLPSLYVEQAD